MEKFMNVIAASSLFRGIEGEDLGAVLRCLEARTRRYEKGETVIAAGGRVTEIGLVLCGSVLLSKLDYSGNVLLLDKTEEGAVFGESLACLGGVNRSLNVTAAEKTEILFLDVGRVVKTCSSACSFHQRIIENLLMDIARKNQRLNLKMEHLSKRTTKEKLLSYLSSYCGEQE
ncbi:MAG: Crp/Fnr family transcriptional regulator, partial [Clostridia bacterium]